MQHHQLPLAEKEEPPVRQMQPSFSSALPGRAGPDPAPWESWNWIDSVIEHSRLVPAFALQRFLALRRARSWRRDRPDFRRAANQRRSRALRLFAGRSLYRPTVSKVKPALDIAAVSPSISWRLARFGYSRWQ